MSSTADLARILRENYLHPPSGKQTVEIHLFGIRYADALRVHSIAEVVERAGLPKSYVNEISKGRALAPFVRVLDA